jgi:L-lactate dehydrogenase complex protein LldG
MNSNGRSQIMQNIRRAVNQPHLALDRQRQLSSFQPRPFAPKELISRWRQELEALTGHVYGPFGPEAALNQVTAMIRAQQAGQVLTWDDTNLPLAGLARHLEANGIRAVQAGDAPDHQANAAIPLGITGALAGLADTGSIVVASGPGQARSCSLLPPVHLALLRVSNLYPDLPTWMAQQGAGLLPSAANLVIITGPSRTADIELALVLGVHGPREIHVILVDEAEV